MKWEDLVPVFGSEKLRRFDWVDADGHKRAWLLTEDDALYDLPPEDAAKIIMGWE